MNLREHCLVQIEDETTVTLVGGERIYNVHTMSKCQSRFKDNKNGFRAPCCIHNPSNHHMRSWDMVPVLRSMSSGVLMYRRCEHDILHPDPDSLNQSEMAGHSCDGCCDGDMLQVVIFDSP